MTKLKNFIRHKLGFRDIYYIQNNMPHIKAELPILDGDIVRLPIGGLLIDSGCVISVDGKKYMVVNSVLEVMTYND